MRLKTRVASFTWQAEPGQVPQSTVAPTFDTSQRCSNLSADLNVGQGWRVLARFTKPRSATTRIEAMGSDRCCRWITTSRSAWYIESETKRRKMPVSVPAASASGATAKAPTFAASQ